MALVKVYRGVYRFPPVGADRSPISQSGVDLGEPLGRHWTSDPVVAFNFAHNFTAKAVVDPHSTTREFGEEDDNGEYFNYVTRRPSTRSGAVLEGYVHPKHIVVPHSDEWKDMAASHGIFDPEHRSGEQEVTLRQFAPVHIVRQHLLGRQFGGLQIVEYPRGVKGLV